MANSVFGLGALHVGTETPPNAGDLAVSATNATVLSMRFSPGGGAASYITIGGGGAGGGITNINVSAGATSNNLSALTFNNANGVTFGLTGSVITGSVATTYRASNDAVGLNSAFTAGPLAMTVNSAGISLNASSAAGTTSGFGGNLLSGSMTHNTAGLNLSINHPAWLTTARASNDAVGVNTAATNVTWTVNSSGISLNAGGYAGTGTSATNASVTLNSNGLAISVAAPGGGGAGTMGCFQNFDGVGPATRVGTSNAMMAVVPLAPSFCPTFPGVFTASTFGVMIFGSNTATASSSLAFTHSYSFGIYTRNASTLNLLNSVSTSFAAAGATGNTSLYHGSRWITFHNTHWSASLTFNTGSEYYLAHWIRTSGQGHAVSWVGQSIGTSGQVSGFMYASTATATNMGLGFHYGGQYSTSFSSALPGSIHLTSSSLNRAVALANFIPYVRMVSGGNWLHA